MTELERNRMEEMVRRLNEASEAYYGGRDEIMSNFEWDALFDELTRLEEETGVILPDSPTQKVNTASEDNIAGEKETHEYPALSLAKTKKVEDLQEWAGNRPVWLSWKLDGLTLVLTYDGGRLSRILTRGNGSVGTNITFMKTAIRGIPAEIEEQGHLVVRGEATISYPDFEKLNETISDPAERFANPRNLASGTLALDAKRLDEAGNVVMGENGKAITDMQYAPVIKGVIVMAIVSMLMLLVSFKLNKERVKTKPQPKEKGAAVKAVKQLFANRAFLSISLTALLLLAGQMFTQSFYTYLFDDYFHANWMNLASQACTYSPMLVMMFLLPSMARRIGKKEVCAWGVAAAAVANLILFFLRGMDPSVLMWIFLALCFVSGCGLTTVVMQLWAMATDAIDDIEVKTGSRDDGTAYSVFNFFRKLGQVLAAICVNGALLGMHYRYEKGAVQTLDNLKKMYDLATLIPAVMFALMALILFVYYPLSRSKVEELQVLKEKRLKESYEKKIIDI